MNSVTNLNGIVHHPFSYQIGPLTITGFGLAVLLAFVIAQIISEREAARRGFDTAPYGDFIFAAVVGGLLGAKLYYVILTRDLSTLFSRGGFVFWGGLIGGAALTLAVVKRKKLRLLQVCDLAAPAIAAAYSIGRTGCWAVGDDYGRPWNSPLAVAFPDGAPPSTAFNMRQLFGVPVPSGMAPDTVLSVYPTQVYEVALGFVMFAILWRLRDHKHAEGWLFGVYLVLAGVERFLIEFLRAKDDRFFGILTTAQVLAIAAVLGGALLMSMRANVGPGKPGIMNTAAVRV